MKKSVFTRLSALVLALLLLAGCSADPGPEPSSTGQTDTPSSTGGSVSTSSTSTSITKEPDGKPGLPEKAPSLVPGVYTANDPANTLLIYDVGPDSFSLCFSSVLFDNLHMSLRATAKLDGSEAVLSFENEDPQSSYGGLLTLEEDGGLQVELRRSSESTSTFTGAYTLLRKLTDGISARPFDLSEMLIDGRPFDLLTAEDADAIFGEPVEVDDYEFYEDDTAQLRQYESVTLNIFKTVFLAQIFDPEFVSPRGIRVGDSWETALALFPDAGLEKETTGDGLSRRVLYGDATYFQSYGELWFSQAGEPEYLVYADRGYTLTYVIEDGWIASVEFTMPTM